MRIRLLHVVALITWLSLYLGLNLDSSISAYFCSAAGNFFAGCVAIGCIGYYWNLKRLVDNRHPLRRVLAVIHWTNLLIALAIGIGVVSLIAIVVTCTELGSTGCACSCFLGLIPGVVIGLVLKSAYGSLQTESA